jgi:hypothetical protein
MSSLSASLRRYWSKVGTPGQEAVILLLLAFLALVPRLYRINSAPAGLSADELFNTIDALRLGPGSWQVYFEGNNGREALFLYLMAFSLRLFGQQRVQPARGFYCLGVYGRLSMAGLTIALGITGCEPDLHERLDHLLI